MDTWYAPNKELSFAPIIILAEKIWLEKYFFSRDKWYSWPRNLDSFTWTKKFGWGVCSGSKWNCLVQNHVFALFHLDLFYIFSIRLMFLMQNFTLFLMVLELDRYLQYIKRYRCLKNYQKWTRTLISRRIIKMVNCNGHVVCS